MKGFQFEEETRIHDNHKSFGISRHTAMINAAEPLFPVHLPED
jgi:hypothetical protein